MPQFDLTARIQARLVGLDNIKKQIKGLSQNYVPLLVYAKNLDKERAKIQKSLSGAKIKIDFDTSSLKNVTQFKSTLNGLNRELKDLVRNARSAKAVIDGLAQSFSKFGQTSTKIVEQKKAVQSLTQEVERGTTAISEFGRVSGLSLRRNAGFLLATTAVFGFTVAVKEAFTEAIAFERQLVKVAQVSGRSVSSLSSLTKEVTRLSTSLGVSSSDLIDVSQILAQAGLSFTQTREALDALAKTTLSATFGDIRDTTEGAIAIMAQFKIRADELGEALGSVNSVSAEFAVESDDLIAAVKRSGGVFAQTSKGIGIDGKTALNQFIALFTSVRATTRESAESIATGLRTIFIRLERPDTIKFFKQLGIELTDIEGKFIGPFKAINALSQGLAGLDRRSLLFAKVVEELGGIRQAGKVIPLLTESALAFDALKIAQEGQNSVNEDSIQAQQALAVQIQKTREQFVALIRDIGQTDTFKIFVDGIIQGTQVLIDFAAAIKPVLPLVAALAGIKAFQFSKEFFRGPRGGTTGFFAGLGGKGGFAEGGAVTGGSGGIDDIPARLTAGEFVLRKEAVRAIGLPILHRLNLLKGRGNSGGSGASGLVGGVPGFAKGGFVGIDNFIGSSNKSKPIEIVLKIRDSSGNVVGSKTHSGSGEQIVDEISGVGQSNLAPPAKTRSKLTQDRIAKLRKAAGIGIGPQEEKATSLTSRIDILGGTPIAKSVVSNQPGLKATKESTDALSQFARAANQSKDNLDDFKNTVLGTRNRFGGVLNKQQSLFNNGSRKELSADEDLLASIAGRPIGAAPVRIPTSGNSTIHGFKRITNAGIDAALASGAGVFPSGANRQLDLFDDPTFEDVGSTSRVSRSSLRQANKKRLFKTRAIESFPTFSSGIANLGSLSSGFANSRAGGLTQKVGSAATGRAGFFGLLAADAIGNTLKNNGFNKTAAGVTGAASGGVIGAQIGSLAGPIGAGLGAIGGAIFGLVTSIKNASLAEELDRISNAFNTKIGDIEKAADSLNEKNGLDNLQTSFKGLSKATFDSQQLSLRDKARPVGSISLLSDRQFDDRLKFNRGAALQAAQDSRSSLKTAGQASLAALTKLGGQGKTFEQAVESLSPQQITALAFKTGGKQELTSLGQTTSVKELNRTSRSQVLSGPLKAQFEAQQKSVKDLKDYNAAVAAAAQGTDLLLDRLNNFGAGLDRIAEFGREATKSNDALISRRNGGAGINTRQIQNVFANPKAFTLEEVSRSARSLGGNDKEGKELSRALIGSKQVQDNLPRVLNTLDTQLKNFDKGGKVGDALIEETVQKNFSGLPDVLKKNLTLQLQNQFKNPGSLSESLAKGGIKADFTKQIDEVGKKFVDVFNKNIADFEQVLNQWVSLNKEANEAADKSVQIQIEDFNTRKQLSGKFLSVEDRSAGANTQINRLGSSAGIKGIISVQSLAAQEGDLTRKLQGPFSGAPDEIAKQMTFLTTQQQSAVEALNAIVNNTDEQVALQTDLNSIIDARGAARNALEDFQFASPSEQRKTLRSIDLANQVREGGELFSLKDKQEARGGQKLLDTFARSQGPEAGFALDQQFLNATANNLGAQELFGATQDVGFNRGTNLKDFLFRDDNNFQDRLGRLNNVQSNRQDAQVALSKINRRDTDQFLKNGQQAFDNVQQGLFNPDGLLDRLNKTLGEISIPEEIKIGGTIALSVNLNGAEAYASIMPEIQKLVQSEIEKQVNSRVNPLTGETNRA